MLDVPSSTKHYNVYHPISGSKGIYAMMEDSHLEMDYEDRFVSDMDNEERTAWNTDPERSSVYADKQPFLSVLDIARLRGVKEVNGTINGGEFIRLGLPFLAGCQHCHATLGPYNAYPSKTGFIQCAECLDYTDMGFHTLEQFEAFNEN
jgi:hypothetical protein